MRCAYKCRKTDQTTSQEIHKSVMNETRPVTLITGASAGIGAELARVFMTHGHELVLVARRQERLAALAAEIVAHGGRQPLVLAVDLARVDAVATIAAALSSAGLAPQYVVNNAGFGLVGHAASLSRAEQLEMLDVNIRALTDLSLAFVDSLERHRGGILNVASIAAFVPGPGMAVYYASKAYVLSFSEALSVELKARGIRVTALCPGPVKTEFAQRAGVKSAGSGGRPGRLSVPAARVAEAGYRALMAGRRRAIPGLLPRLAVGLMALVPNALLLGAVDYRQSRRRSAMQASGSPASDT
jgi:short-subunit dehydrogenase